MQEFNVNSAKLKRINKEGMVTVESGFSYNKSVPSRFSGKKTVCATKSIDAKNSKSLMRRLLGDLGYKAKIGEYFVLQVKTTKGQYYMSNLR